jgi:hypothetical protein
MHGYLRHKVILTALQTQVTFVSLVSFGSLTFYLQSDVFSFSARYNGLLVDLRSYNKTWSRPDVHVLVDARVRDLGLCRTLLSAIAQGYPSPILVGYHNEPSRADALEVFESIRDMIIEPPTAEEDIVLWLGREHWTQLPVEITVRRFLQHADVMALKADKRHHRMSEEVDDTCDRQPGNRIRKQLVLFPASKACVYNCQDADAIPESTLPRDIFGPLTDNVRCNSTLKRARFIAPGAFLGQAQDIAASLADLIGYLRHTNGSGTGVEEQRVWSHLFLAQELQRSAEQEKSSATDWMHRTMDILTQYYPVSSTSIIDLSSAHNTTTGNPNHDHGLTLDYESRIFQVLSHSERDMHFLTCDHPQIIHSPSRQAKLYSHPIRLPPRTRVAVHKHPLIPHPSAYPPTPSLSQPTTPFLTPVCPPCSTSTRRRISRTPGGDACGSTRMPGRC